MKPNEIIEKVAELKGQRAAIVEKSGGVIALAEADGRNMTADEQARFDQWIGQAETLAVEIRLNEQAWREHPDTQMIGRPDSDTTHVGGAQTTAATDGTLGIEQLLADLGAVKATATPELREARLGEFIAGVVTGDWENREVERRALAGNLDAGGGYLIPATLAAEVIDLARNQARVFQAGARTVPMATRSLAVPHITGDPTAYWRGENQEITESSMTFGRTDLEAKVLAARITVPIELLEDAPLIAGAIENAIAQSLALELDRAALVGSGAGEEPKGILNWDGVAITTVSTAVTYDAISTGLQALAVLNITPNAWLTSPAITGYMQRLKDGEGRYQMPLPESLAGLQKLTTNQVPQTRGDGDDSMMFLADWSQLWVGMRSELKIVVSREAGDSLKNLQAMIVAFLRADVAVVRPAAFHILDDLDI